MAGHGEKFGRKKEAARPHNIQNRLAAIYGVEERALVMELVEGLPKGDCLGQRQFIRTLSGIAA